MATKKTPAATKAPGSGKPAASKRKAAPPAAPPAVEAQTEEGYEVGITRAALVDAAQDLTAQMDLDPPIDVSDEVTDELLKEKVLSIANNPKLLVVNDYLPSPAPDPLPEGYVPPRLLSADTVETLRLLGVKIEESLVPEHPADPDKNGKGKGKKAATPKPPKDGSPKDSFGFRIGSKNSQAMEMLASGNFTMAQVKEKLGATYYSALNAIKPRGWVVAQAEGGKFKISKS